MATLQLNTHALHYEWSGALDTHDAPVLVFSNSLGTDLSLWDAQMDEFNKTHRVLRYDTRGHGKSSAPAGPYTLAELSGDFLALIDRLGIQRVAVCGISLGGLTALWLAINAPHRITAIVAANTAARIGTHSGWDSRIVHVQREGVPSLVPETLERWFTRPSLDSRPELGNFVKRSLEGVSQEGYLACCAALRDADLRGEVSSIDVPSLIVAGLHDAATTPADAEFLASHIRGAQLATLGTAHLSNMEDSANFNRQALAFLRLHNA